VRKSKFLEKVQKQVRWLLCNLPPVECLPTCTLNLSVLFPLLSYALEGDKIRRKRRGRGTIADDSPTLIIPPMLMTILQKRGTFVGPRGPLMSSITQLSLSKLVLPLSNKSLQISRTIPRSIPTARYRLLPPKGRD
jgi:hypothetical protein